MAVGKVFVVNNKVHDTAMINSATGKNNSRSNTTQLKKSMVGSVLFHKRPPNGAASASRLDSRLFPKPAGKGTDEKRRSAFLVPSGQSDSKILLSGAPKSKTVKAHQKELLKIKSKKARGTKPPERNLTTQLSARQELRNADPKSSTTFAFWETGMTGEGGAAVGQANNGLEGEHTGHLDEYMKELDELQKHGVIRKCVDNTFENDLLLPNCVLKIVWDWMVLFMVIYNCVVIPLKISFYKEQSNSSKTIDQVINVCLILDILVSFRTCHIDHRQNIVSDKNIVRKMYVRKKLAIDLIGSIPFDLLAHSLGLDAMTGELISLLGLLRFMRLVSSARLSGSMWNKPSIRIMKLMLGFYILAHWFGCLFFFVGINQPPSDKISWIDKANLDEADPFEQYTASIYWALTTMVTVGYGDISAQTRYERLFNVPVLLLATLIYATIFGNVSYAVESMSSTFRRYQNKMDTCAEFTTQFQLNEVLSRKLTAYTDEIFNQNKGFDMDALLGALPRSVRADILLHLHPNIIQSVPLFEGVTENFIEAMILKLGSMVCLSDDYIFRENDKSKEMYFLRTGIVEVEITGRGVVGDLGSGSHFGEIAMLLGHKRPSSIRAVTKCELSYLTQDDFADLLFVFPEYEENVRIKARRYVLRDVLQEGEPETSQMEARHNQIFKARTAKLSGYIAEGEEQNGPGRPPVMGRRPSILDQLDQTKAKTLQRAAAAPMPDENPDDRDETLFGRGQGGLPNLSNLQNQMEASVIASHISGAQAEEYDSSDDEVTELAPAQARWNMLASLFGPAKNRPDLGLQTKPLSVLKSGGVLNIAEHRAKLAKVPLRKQQKRKGGNGERVDWDDPLAQAGSVFEKLQSMRRPIMSKIGSSNNHERRPMSEEGLHVPVELVKAVMQEMEMKMNAMETRMENKMDQKLRVISAQLEALTAMLTLPKPTGVALPQRLVFGHSKNATHPLQAGSHKEAGATVEPDEHEHRSDAV